MKTFTLAFLKKLEKELSMSFNWMNNNPTEKFTNKWNQLVEVDDLFLMDLNLVFLITSCGCKTCKNVLEVQIFYGFGGSNLIGAETAKQAINKIAPKTQVLIFDLFDPFNPKSME